MDYIQSVLEKIKCDQDDYSQRQKQIDHLRTFVEDNRHPPLDQVLSNAKIISEDHEGTGSVLQIPDLDRCDLGH